MPEQNELQIVLTLVDEATAKLKQVRDEIGKTTKETDKNNKSVIDGFKEQQKEGISLIRMVTRVGFIWGATFGLMIKSVLDLGKEIEALDKLSFKLGVSASDLSIRFYGFDITTQSARVGVASLHNTFSGFNEILLKTKLGVADIISTNDILLKQYGVLGAAMMGLTGFAPKPKMSTDDAVAQILQENIIKRQASKEGQALLIEEDNLFNQLSLSKVEFTRNQFGQQLGLLEYYGINTERIRESFATREAQDQEIQLNQLIAQRYEAEGKVTQALGYQLDAQLMLFKRVWGTDGKVIQEWIKTQKILAEQKVWEATIQNIKNVGTSLGGLSSALTAYAQVNRSMAKAAKAVALASAIVDTASAVMSALNTKPFFPVGISMGVMAAATGALQIATISAQQFAQGGRPPIGVPSIVGERGPELFMPDSAGTIIPNNRLGNMGNQTSIHIEINNLQVRSDEDIDLLTEQISLRLAREAERL